jgi:Lar family restriction alleviation protein
MRDRNNMFRNSINVVGDASVTFSEQPLPCPFCGRSELWLHGDILPKFVACKKCSAFGPTAPTASQAIERWNIRQGGAPSVAKIDDRTSIDSVARGIPR